MPNPSLRGIVIVNSSLEAAQQQYGEVATGKNVNPLQDHSGKFVVLASSRSEFIMMNPETGAMDMIPHDGITDRLKFVANSAQELAVNHAACASCKVHVLADDPSLVQKCPVCTSDIDFNALPERQSAIASGRSFNEAVQAFVATMSGEAAPVATLSDDCLVAVAGAVNFDAYTGRPAVRIKTEGAYKAVAAAAPGDSLEAHYFVCASECETPFVVSSDDLPLFCPACAGSLLEPEDEDLEEAEEFASDFEDEDGDFEGTASSDEDDEDYEDDEDDEDEDLSFLDDEGDEDDDEDEGDSDDEDDFEGTASSNEDDDEDDEDDDSDDEDDDSDDEDDEDEGVSLSLASSPRRIRARTKSVASASMDTEMVKASYLSIASTKGGAMDQFQVVYAGTVQGENTWYATINRIPVAMAIASETAHPDVFNKDVFATVVTNTAEEQGIPAALDQFNFQEIKPEIEVGEHVGTEIRQAVDEQVGEMREEMREEKSELNSRVAAALAIAASGINRGFFRGLDNPVISNLVESLSAVGITNADTMIAKAFSDHSDNYHRTLLEKAQEIMTYDKDVQNQLAQAVSESNVYSAQASTNGPLGRTIQAAPQAQQPIKAVASSTDSGSSEFQSRIAAALSSL